MTTVAEMQARIVREAVQEATRASFAEGRAPNLEPDVTGAYVSEYTEIEGGDLTNATAVASADLNDLEEEWSYCITALR